MSYNYNYNNKASQITPTAPPGFSMAPNPNGSPPSYYPPSGQTVPNNAYRDQDFTNILMRYEINPEFATRLQKFLIMTKIVFIFDDSGSMNSVLNDSPLNSSVFKACRWDELKQFAKITLEIANIFNPEGVDVHFLNRPPARRVQNIQNLEPFLANKPGGFTPIRRVLQAVLAENNQMQLAERKLLIIIVTDGEPTDDSGRSDIPGLKQILQSRDTFVYTSIVACTDEDNVMDYLTNWDKNIPRLDVVDDYRNEKVEIQRAKGQGFPFSYGDYVVKSLIGSLDSQFDNMDELPGFGGFQLNRNYNNNAPYSGGFQTNGNYNYPPYSGAFQPNRNYNNNASYKFRPNQPKQVNNDCCTIV